MLQETAAGMERKKEENVLILIHKVPWLPDKKKQDLHHSLSKLHNCNFLASGLATSAEGGAQKGKLMHSEAPDLAMSTTAAP